MLCARHVDMQALPPGSQRRQAQLAARHAASRAPAERLHARQGLAAQPLKLAPENEGLHLQAQGGGGARRVREGTRTDATSHGCAGAGGAASGQGAGGLPRPLPGALEPQRAPRAQEHPRPHLHPHVRRRTLLTRRGTPAMASRNCSGGDSSEGGPRYIFRAFASSMLGAICS